MPQMGEEYNYYDYEGGTSTSQPLECCVGQDCCPAEGEIWPIWASEFEAFCCEEGKVTQDLDNKEICCCLNEDH
jgi:hypothetical protein